MPELAAIVGTLDCIVIGRPLELAETQRFRSDQLRDRLRGASCRPRREAVTAATRAGAVVHSGPSSKTTVVVRGRPNAQQAAGKEAGLKLMEIRRLRTAGHRITLVTESQFWRLTAAKR